MFSVVDRPARRARGGRAAGAYPPADPGLGPRRRVHVRRRHGAARAEVLTPLAGRDLRLRRRARRNAGLRCGWRPRWPRARSPRAPTTPTTTSGGRSETPPVASAAPSDAGTPEVAGNGTGPARRPAARAPPGRRSPPWSPPRPRSPIRRPGRRSSCAPPACSSSSTASSGPARAWDAAVRAGLPRSLRSVVRDNVASRREFRAMHSELADTLPAWRIVAPAPAEDLLRYYKRGERAFGIGWEYLAAINLVETGMGRIRGTSVAGAQGPMQFLPHDVGKVGPRRHPGPGGRDHGRRPLPGARRWRPAVTPGRRAVPLQQLRPLRPRRDPAGEGHGTTAAGVLRLLPLGHLLPDRARRRTPAGRLRPRPSRCRSSAGWPRTHSDRVGAQSRRSQVRRRAWPRRSRRRPGPGTPCAARRRNPSAARRPSRPRRRRRR